MRAQAINLKIVYLTRFILSAGESGSSSHRSRSSSSSSEDEVMDWTDNLHGLKELYEEGQALVLREREGGDKAPPANDATEAAAAAAVEPAAEPTAATQRPPEGLGGEKTADGKLTGDPRVPARGGGEGEIGREEDVVENIVEKARAFVEKKRLETIGRIKAALGDKCLAYDAIIAARKKDFKTPHLLGGEAAELPDVGSFLGGGDGRILLSHVEVNLGQRRVTSFSFNPTTLSCLCNGSHSIRKIASSRGEYKATREAFLLTDQAYPAALPSSTDKLCINVIRIDHGMLIELAAALENVLRGRFLEAGSLVALFSATNLAESGLDGYCADLVQTIDRLKCNVGEHVVYTPAPHLFGGGCNDGAAIRAAIEVGAWSIHVFGRDCCHLKRSFDTANDMISQAGYGDVQTATTGRYRLPGANGKYRTWISGGMDALPSKLGPVSAANEKLMITTMIQEIRTGMAIDLEPTPSFERGVDWCLAQSTTGGFLIVGSSNAKRLHTAIVGGGTAAELIYEPNLKITKNSVQLLEEKIKLSIKSKRPDLIVLQLLDGSVFFTMTEEGTKIPMEHTGGRYHAPGDLALADKQAMEKILKLCKPLLQAADNIKTVVVGPLPRYITAGCCSNEEHMPNRKAPRFLERMVTDLAVLQKSIKDFLFTENLRSARAMDPWVGLRDMQVSSLWGADPLHVRQEHFGPLVEGVRITAEKIANNGNAKKRVGGSDSSESKRSKSDLHRRGDGGSSMGRGGGPGGPHSGGRRSSFN
jgi:hypothetical protein